MKMKGFRKFTVEDGLDIHGKWHWWMPGIQNYPQEKRHRFLNNTPFSKKTTIDRTNEYTKYDFHVVPFNLKYEPEVPEEILAHKPLYWLFQVIDTEHVRMAFKANPGDPWYFSEVYTFPKGIDEITEFGCIMWDTVTGRHFGLPPGTPVYQQFLFDHIYYRYGLSENE